MTANSERKLKTFAVKIDAWQKLEDLKHQLETLDDRIYLLKEFDNEEAEELRAHLTNLRGNAPAPLTSRTVNLQATTKPRKEAVETASPTHHAVY